MEAVRPVRAGSRTCTSTPPTRRRRRERAPRQRPSPSGGTSPSPSRAAAAGTTPARLSSSAGVVPASRAASAKRFAQTFRFVLALAQRRRALLHHDPVPVAGRELGRCRPRVPVVLEAVAARRDRLRVERPPAGRGERRHVGGQVVRGGRGCSRRRALEATDGPGAGAADGTSERGDARGRRRRRGARPRRYGRRCRAATDFARLQSVRVG